jgi:hypothetical protein
MTALSHKKHFHEADTPLTKNTAHAFSGYNRSAVTPLCCDNVSPRVSSHLLFIARSTLAVSAKDVP